MIEDIFRGRPIDARERLHVIRRDPVTGRKR